MSALHNRTQADLCKNERKKGMRSLSKQSFLMSEFPSFYERFMDSITFLVYLIFEYLFTREDFWTRKPVKNVEAPRRALYRLNQNVEDLRRCFHWLEAEYITESLLPSLKKPLWLVLQKCNSYLKGTFYGYSGKLRKKVEAQN